MYARKCFGSFSPFLLSCRSSTGFTRVTCHRFPIRFMTDTAAKKTAAPQKLLRVIVNSVCTGSCEARSRKANINLPNTAPTIPPAAIEMP